MNLRNVLIIVFSSFFGAGMALFINKNIQEETKTITPNPIAVPVKTASYIPNSPQTLDFTKASSIATKAVVHVNTTTMNNASTGELDAQDMLQYFFGPPKINKPRESRGSGSGVIISSDGYIVTNNHVIENSDEIAITLSNNKTYSATLVGADKDTDLALLKIEESNLSYLKFANSDSVMVGEWVLAVGNPFNLASTVTAGIVSAKGRNINILENIQGKSNTAIESFIQTDAAINPGNSGGALVNTRGEVIGINTAIATPTGTYAGYAFAVPSNIAGKVVADLKEFGMVQRAFLGVNILSVNSDIAEELNLPSPNGVYIQNVMPGGAADDGGLKNEDIILSIDGVRTDDVAALQEKIASYRPGSVIEVSFLRKNKVQYATLSLKNKFNNQKPLRTENLEKRDLGIALKNLDPTALASLGLKNGIEVVSIKENGLVDTYTNMKEGFIITMIDNERVTSVEDFTKIVENKGKVIIEGRYKQSKTSYLYALDIE